MSTKHWTAYELNGRLELRQSPRPYTALMAKWIASHKRAESIEYNREWVPEGQERAYSPDKYRWIEHPADGLRFVGKVHEIRGSGEGNMPYFDRALVDHNGWFTDSWQDATVCGEVYQLPARNGKSLYVPAISDSDGNEGACIDFHDVTDDLREAIRSADGMAERYAEQEREYQAKESAKMRIEDITTETKETRASIKALTAELKQTKGISPRSEVCKALRAHIAGLRAEMRRLKAEKEKLTDNYWESVSSW